VRSARPVLGVTLAAMALPLVLLAQQPPAPQPFPRSGGGSAPPPAAPAAPAPAPPRAGLPVAAPPPANGVPNDASLGISGVIYPGSEFLRSITLELGQRCYLFGTKALFAEVVTYYKQALKDSGRELFKAPAMQQFDIAKFQDKTMAYPPAVTVKDYTFNNSEGYLQVDGLTQKRFKTVIQIVPVPGK
jgi:hypothetical protein